MAISFRLIINSPFFKPRNTTLTSPFFTLGRSASISFSTAWMFTVSLLFTNALMALPPFASAKRHKSDHPEIVATSCTYPSSEYRFPGPFLPDTRYVLITKLPFSISGDRLFSLNVLL
jgi:hypothetical protein